jgi:large subunit ribosomal protein L21
MYAILQQSGHQYRVSPGDRLLVDRLAAEVGTVVALEPVVLVQDDGGTKVGTPVVDGARVAAVVVSHRKGAKIRVFKYKPKKRYRRTHGHRSLLTELRIEAVLAAGEPLPEPKAAAAAPEKAPEAPAKGRRGKAKTAAPEAAAPATEKAAAAPAPEATQAVEDAEAPQWPQAEAPEAAAEAAEAPAAEEAPAPKRAPRSRAKKAAEPAAETDTETDTETETAAGDPGETEG